MEAIMPRTTETPTIMRAGIVQEIITRPPIKARITAINPSHLPTVKAVPIDTTNTAIGIIQKNTPKPGCMELAHSTNALMTSVSGFTPTAIQKPLIKPKPSTIALTKYGRPSKMFMTAVHIYLSWKDFVDSVFVEEGLGEKWKVALAGENTTYFDGLDKERCRF